MEHQYPFAQKTNMSPHEGPKGSIIYDLCKFYKRSFYRKSYTYIYKCSSDIPWKIYSKTLKNIAVVVHEKIIDIPNKPWKLALKMWTNKALINFE